MKWALVVVVAIAGCGADDDGGDADGTVDDGGLPELVDIAVTTSRPLDVLFVVDDSATMLQEQAALADALPAFVEELTATEELVDLHVGFVSSNLGTAPAGSGGDSCAGRGDDGHLLVRATCPALTDGAPFVAHRLEPAGDAEVNYTGELATQLECMAALGTAGCGFEQHLESMRRGLMNEVENAGFLREQANLAVVVLADEDDCSASDRALFIEQPGGDTRDSELGELSSYRCFEFGVSCDGDPEDERALGPRAGCVTDDDSVYIEPIATYAQFLIGLKGGSHRVVYSAIVGDVGPVTVGIEASRDQLWVEPQCRICPDGSSDGCAAGSELVAAFPAIRFHALADRLAGRSAVEDICSYGPDAEALDYTAALARLGERLRVDGGTRCLASAPADRDAATAGIQPLCELTEGEQAIPSCAELSAPCWYITHAPECEGSETALVIDRGDSQPVAGEVALRCAL
jgi:hypothetical protein